MFKKTLAIALTTTAILGTSTAVYANTHTATAATGDEAFKKLDTNNDGHISKEEFLAKAEARFAKKDKNSDGKLSKEEFIVKKTAKKAAPAATKEAAPK